MYTAKDTTQIMQAIQNNMNEFLVECGLSLQISEDVSINSFRFHFRTATGLSLMQIVNCEDLRHGDISYTLDYVKHKVKDTLKNELLKQQKNMRKEESPGWRYWDNGTAVPRNLNYHDSEELEREAYDSTSYGGYTTTAIKEPEPLIMNMLKKAMDNLTKDESPIDALRNKIDKGLQPILDMLTRV